MKAFGFALAKKVNEFLPQLLKMKRPGGFPLRQHINVEGEYVSQLVPGFMGKLTREKGRGLNTHKSNRAKRGLFFITYFDHLFNLRKSNYLYSRSLSRHRCEIGK